jgi:DNA polymerase III sliding clamp (beta) subunit (PCNA family)
LARLVKDCGVSDSITLEPGKNDRVHVGYPIGNQKGELHLESIPANEFPPIPQIKGETCAIKDEVRQSIVEALQCASTDETRMILQGAYLDVSDKKTTTSSARMESTSSAATHSRCR